ncbi:MAG: F0F1 ATP synthase subunit gamma [Candidatus Omnitrophica bacterium]|nr:F0F1 ATP synthase subunit gamma [Candidatus Omnitrophota bacterium]
MGKANKVKGELSDANEMVTLIQTLKDIADNKFFTLINDKDKFRRFGETFVEFFRLISFSKVNHPLIRNDNPTVGILVVTGEGSFLGEFNNKIFRLALTESEKHEKYKFIGVGEKCTDRLVRYTPDLKVFTGIDIARIYELAVDVKDFLVKQIMEEKIGKVIVAYSWPKTFDLQKPRITKLMPCDDLLAKQAQFVQQIENVIEESDPGDIIGYLANLWLTTRLYEIFMDTIIAASAAQSQFLDDSLDKMKKEQVKVKMKYRKAKKGDIDKSLRETFSARMMTVS